jgi:hypothetical protein
MFQFWPERYTRTQLRVYSPTTATQCLYPGLPVLDIKYIQEFTPFSHLLFSTLYSHLPCNINTLLHKIMSPRHPSDLLSHPSTSIRRRVSSTHEHRPQNEIFFSSSDEAAIYSINAEIPTSRTVDLDRPLPPLPLTPAHSHSALRRNDDELHNQAFEAIDLSEDGSSTRDGRATPSLSVSIPGFSIHSVVSRFWQPYAPSLGPTRSSRSEPRSTTHASTLPGNSSSSVTPQKSLPNLFPERSSSILNPRSWLTRTIPLSLIPGVTQSDAGSSGALDRNDSRRSNTTNSSIGSESTMISLADKFTNKWPELRRLSTRNSLGRQQRNINRKQEGMSSIAAALEDGSGLGIDGIGRWTIHKWFLIFSVCTLFSYGVVGMLIVVKTWFHGQCFLFQCVVTLRVACLLPVPSL